MIYLTPILVILLGIVLYLVLFPSYLNQFYLLIVWLFTNPHKIVDSNANPCILLSKMPNNTIVRVYLVLWTVAFIFSLFLVGRHIHLKRPSKIKENTSIKKQLCLKNIDIQDKLLLHNDSQNNNKLKQLINEINYLSKRISAESEFEGGNEDITDCENMIVKQMDLLVKSAYSIEKEDSLKKNISDMYDLVSNINTLLTKRTELKRR